jgi:uncharacterized membrane protein YecN with MAPEG domain
MKDQTERVPVRERYRAFVSLAIIPLGLVIVIRAALAGLAAWTLILLGLALIGLGISRLRSYLLSGMLSRRK